MDRNFSLNYDLSDPMEVIDELKEIIIAKAEAKHLECKIIINNKFMDRINCDSRRLLQVLLNLSLNAIKYTFYGKIAIIFSQEDEKLKIIIQDTGIGISSSELNKINKIFGLLEKKCVNNQTGICLGLTVSKSIINEMNGSLDIISSINSGTTCNVEIPLINFNEYPINISSTLKLEKSPYDLLISGYDLQGSSTSRIEISSKPSVIVVDDEPFIQLAISTILNKLGCDVDKADNGKIAIDKVKERASQGRLYNMIFMDANMPLMNGYESAKIIREVISEDIPIICISAQESDRHKNLCKEAGMNEIITKPCTKGILNEILIKYKLK